MDSERIDVLIRRSEDLLRICFGSGVRLCTPHIISRRARSLVVRCAVSGWDDVASVIIKRNLGDDQRGFTDWASLAFLATVENSRTFAPRFYAGDPDGRFFVMENLGPPFSLEDLFATGDVRAITTALRSLATSMARLVTNTQGRETGFEDLRAMLPGNLAINRRDEAARWLAALDRVVQWSERLEIAPPRGFEASCEHVAAIFADPGPFLSFSHGDPAPSNNHIAPGRSCLIDFEYAGYRHALYDITGWDSLCPLPPRLLSEIADTFRSALLAGPGEASYVDEESYREAWETMCAYRTLAIITWMSPDLLEQDSIWVASWTRRSALLSAVSRLSRVGEGSPALEPLAVLGSRMFEALHARWPELGDGRPHLIATGSDLP